MGEHDDGHREDDESAPEPSADSPPDDDDPVDADDDPAEAPSEESARSSENGEATAEPDSNDVSDDADGPEGSDQPDGDGVSDDGDDSEDGDDSDDGDDSEDGDDSDDTPGENEGRPGLNQYETHDPMPSAEEWLAENDPEYDPEADQLGDAEADQGDDASEDSVASDDDVTREATASGDDENEISSDAADHDELHEETADTDTDAETDQSSDDSGDDPASSDGDATRRDGDPAPSDDGASSSDVDAETASDDDAPSTEEEPASASTPVSTSDPGKNAPAGMGKPAPAGGGGSTAGAGSYPDFDPDMAPDDQEQPLADHIEEMTHRLLVVVVVMGLVASVALLWSDDMINFLWYSFLGPNDGTCPGTACPLEWRPHVYHPLSLLLARLKVAMLVGFVAGLPVAVYQAYRFMRPGLYPQERRYYLASVPTSLVLAVAGLAFAYFVVLPSLFIYFSAYSTQAAELAFALSDTFNLMVMMLGFFAVIFQIPLLVMLAIMMGVTTRRWLEQRRIYFWTGFGGVAFFFSPDPTGMAPLIVAITMIALFEGTLLLLRWTERSVALVSAETMANNRPYAWALAAILGYLLSAGPVPSGYFDALPPVFVETLTEWGYLGLTPAVIAAAIVATFELLGVIVRRVAAGQGRRTGLRVRLAFLRVRPFVWVLAIVVGYMGSPEPELLTAVEQLNLPALQAAGIVVGLIAVWELLRLLLSYVRPN